MDGFNNVLVFGIWPKAEILIPQDKSWNFAFSGIPSSGEITRNSGRRKPAGPDRIPVGGVPGGIKSAEIRVPVELIRKISSDQNSA